MCVWLSEVSRAHAEKLVSSHDQLLQNTLQNGTYHKLYSFKHIVNGFAIHATPSQVGNQICVSRTKTNCIMT